MPRCAAMNIIPSPKNGFYYHSHNFLQRYYHHYRRRLCDCFCCCRCLCWRFVYKSVVNGMCICYKIKNKLQSDELIIKASKSPQNTCLRGGNARKNTQVNENQTYTTLKRANTAIFCFHFNFTFACFFHK